MRYLLMVLGVIVTSTCLQACNNQNEPERQYMNGNQMEETQKRQGGGGEPNTDTNLPSQQHLE